MFEPGNEALRTSLLFSPFNTLFNNTYKIFTFYTKKSCYRIKTIVDKKKTELSTMFTNFNVTKMCLKRLRSVENSLLDSVIFYKYIMSSFNPGLRKHPSVASRWRILCVSYWLHFIQITVEPTIFHIFLSYIYMSLFVANALKLNRL